MVCAISLLPRLQATRFPETVRRIIDPLKCLISEGHSAAQSIIPEQKTSQAFKLKSPHRWLVTDKRLETGGETIQRRDSRRLQETRSHAKNSSSESAVEAIWISVRAHVFRMRLHFDRSASVVDHAFDIGDLRGHRAPSSTGKSVNRSGEIAGLADNIASMPITEGIADRPSKKAAFLLGSSLSVSVQTFCTRTIH